MNKYKLCELGTFRNGANYPKGSYGKGIPIVNVKDLFTARYVNLSNLSELKSGSIKKEDEYLIENEDILFSRSSLVQSGAGMCAIAHNINSKVLFCGFIIRYRINRRDIVSPLYLLYLLRTATYRKLFTGTQQTNIVNINQDSLGEIVVELPSIEKQNEILSILKKIDDKIDNNNYINDNLQHQLKLLYDYWFTQFDFPNENGKPYRASGGAMVWCDELQREIPKGWKVSTLSDIAVLQAKSVMPQEGTAYNHYSIPAFDDTHSPALEDGEAIASNKYVVPDNSVLVSKLNPQFKRIWLIIDSTDSAICSTEFLPVKATETGVYALYSLLNSDAFSVHLIQNASSSTGSRKRIDPDNCMSYKFPYDQKVFARFDKAIQPLLMKITCIPTETQALVALRNWLLPMLMNGQATISD